MPREALEQVNAQIEALGGDPAKGVRPKPATASTQLLGITKAVRAKLQLHFGRQFPGDDQGADRSGPGRQSRQPGRSERERDSRSPDPRRYRIPQFQEAEVRYRPEALQAMAAQASVDLWRPVSRCFKTTVSSPKEASVGRRWCPKSCRPTDDSAPPETFLPFDELFVPTTTMTSDEDEDEE